MKRRRRSGYAYRDPAEPSKRKRPYERHANLVMDKRVLRRMALQAIGRPDIARGVLHDALLEMFPVEYTGSIERAETRAQQQNTKFAVVFVVRRMSKYRPDDSVRFYERPLAGILNIEYYERTMTRIGLPARVVTYVTRAGKY